MNQKNLFLIGRAIQKKYGVEIQQEILKTPIFKVD